MRWEADGKGMRRGWEADGKGMGRQWEGDGGTWNGISSSGFVELGRNSNCYKCLVL